MFSSVQKVKLSVKSLLVVCFVSFSVQAKENTQKHPHSHHQHMSMQSPSLSEAGNDAFGTIQEVISKLNADPTTDWSKVDLEALRKHLVDMYEMTINVNVISQQPIENGLKVKLEAMGSRAFEALKRVFDAHPMMLESETGWKMKVVNANGVFHLTITTSKADEVDKIRGLGYIGLMAYGNHHQPHHWSMATGDNPHHKNH